MGVKKSTAIRRSPRFGLELAAGHAGCGGSRQRCENKRAA